MRVFTLLSTLWLLTSISLPNLLCNGSNQHFICIENEKKALLEFKQDLKDHVNRLSSWDDEEDCCKWSGIVCDNSTGHVHEIHLRGRDSIGYRRYPTAADLEELLRFRLGGRINPSLLNLKHLKYLDLSNNNFEGIQIPSFIGSLSSLTYLNMSRSGFEGIVPPQLGNLSMIRHLSLGGLSEDKLSVENLKWLSGLSLLHHLDMSGVNLSKASDWLEVMQSLPSLVELCLSNCQLSYIPLQTNVSFTSLSVLDLSFNSFNSPIPRWITSLSSLVFLDISACNFYGPIPDDFRNMTSLRKLDVSSNVNLSPSVFNGLFCLTNLISLRVGYNNFQGPIPSGLQKMTSLRDLYMPGNYFNTSIPNWLYSFNHLESLDLHGNNLQGVISSAIGNMTSLVSLNLSSNQLTGRIPNSFGNLCNLRQIDLSINNFSIRVSEFLKSFRGCCSERMELLYLDKNRLSSHLPNQLCHFNNLAYLSLQSNSIFGPIPTCIGRLSSLKALDLSNNQINGTLPKSLGQLVMLEELIINNNSLIGVVSEVPFSNLTRLRVLMAHDNELTITPHVAWVPPFQLQYTILSSCQLGPKFPLWLQSQRKLYAIDIANTSIVDTIPTWFWSIFSHLTYLNLSHNQIQGKLPSVLNYSCRHPSCDKIDPLFLVAIDLSSNHFDGPLPLVSSDLNLLDLSNNSFSGPLHHFLCDEVGRRQRLEVLNLDNNLLSGEIPDCWMKWQSLSTVKLANNNLIGSIPSSMGHLSSLKSLNMRKNKLSGKLPMVLMNWTELVIIDLAENEFSGSIPTWIGSLTNLKVLNLRWNKFTGDIPHELCCLTFIQILDLAQNNLSGTVPRCFNNFNVMAAKDFSNDTFIDFSVIYPLGKILDSALLVVNGREFEYNTILKFVKILDLSSNNLSGRIPDELMSLQGLIYLSVSRNHLTGRIPEKIGEMRKLESLDLSMNRFFGEIPLSMSSMTFLSRLNLSYNNLKGKIPSSTQLQSFDGSSFIGNALCGPPLTESCEENEVKPNVGNGGEEGVDNHEVDWYVVTGLVVGFVVSFWAVLGPLILSVRWRIAYFQFMDDMRYKLWDVISRHCCSMFNS